MVVRCEVCCTNDFKYECPRCGCRYCCAQCYKKHGGGRCVVQFEKDRDDELANLMRGAKVDEEEKRRVSRIIQDYWVDGLEEDEIEEGIGEEVEALEAASLLLENGQEDQAFDALTEAQKRRFNDLIREQKMKVAEWIPWWEKESADEADDSAVGLTSEATLTAVRKASPLVAFNMVEIVHWFCFVARLYNGDWSETEALDELTARSKVLASDHRYPDVNTCVRSCFELGGDIRSLQDACLVLNNKNHCKRLLRELSDALRKRTEKTSRLLSRKVNFFACWVEGRNVWDLSLLAKSVQGDILEIESMLQSRKNETQLQV